MAKQAQLHDGTFLEFPDETPDEIMDAVVREHLAPSQEEEEEDALPQVVAQATGLLSETVDRLAQSHAETAANQVDALNEQTAAQLEAAQFITQAARKSAEALIEQVSTVAKEAANVAGALEKIEPLANSVDNLSREIRFAATRIVEALMAPSKIVRDAKTNEVQSFGKMKING